MMVEINMPTQY